tara:strand:+ start:5618 stop:6193 length:576 start_codon:yes stop_codon:yes gene_type:complete
MIIGFDISTSITGVALIADGQLAYYDSIDLRKYKDIFSKTVAFKEKLLDLFEAYQLDNEGWMMGASDYPIEHIYIEQSLHMFMGGKSSAKTLSTLTRFNGIASWLIYEIFEIKPKFIGATSARKHAGIKIPRGQKAKQVVLQHLLDNEPAFNIEYTKHGNPKPDSFDKADAIVIAKAGWKLENENVEMAQR